jgi:hypothetical protein
MDCAVDRAAGLCVPGTTLQQGHLPAARTRAR